MFDVIHLSITYKCPYIRPQMHLQIILEYSMYALGALKRLNIENHKFIIKHEKL